MSERLRSEIVSEKFFRGVLGETLPAEIEVSPRTANYYRKMSSEWAEDYAGLVDTEHRKVTIDTGEHNGLKGHFIRCQIVYLTPRRLLLSK